MIWSITSPAPRAKSIRSHISSSFVPLSSTIFSLTGVSPASTAAATPSSTEFSISCPVIRRYRSGCSVSSDTFTRCRPAAARSWAHSERSVPLVVAEMSFMRGRSLMISAKSLRRSGSPPVNLILRTPCARAARTSAAIFSLLISLCACAGVRGDIDSPSPWQ